MPSRASRGSRTIVDRVSGVLLALVFARGVVDRQRCAERSEQCRAGGNEHQRSKTVYERFVQGAGELLAFAVIAHAWHFRLREF